MEMEAGSALCSLGATMWNHERKRSSAAAELLLRLLSALYARSKC